MRTAFLSLLLLLTSSAAIIAQANWRSASLTTKDGNTLTGQVNDRQWSVAIEKIEFRSDKKEKSQLIDASTITALVIGDQQYVGREVNFNASPRSKQELVTKEESVEATAYGLLKVLIGGSIDLLQFYDQQGRDHYFLREADGTLSYLEYGVYRKDYSGRESVRIETNGFRSFLLKRFSDCTSLAAATVATRYKEKALVKLFEEFYTCVGEVAEQPANRSSDWTFGVTAGVIQLSPTFRKAIFKNLYQDLSPMVVSVGGRLIYRPLGLGAGSAFVFGLEHFRYEFTGGTGQELPYKREQTMRFSVGPRFNITKGNNPLYGGFIVGYDVLLKFEQTSPPVENPINPSGPFLIPSRFINRNGSGGFWIGGDLGIVFGRADFSVRASIADRNLRGFPTEILFGFGGTFGYSF